MNKIIIYENSDKDSKVDMTFEAKSIVSEVTGYQRNKHYVFKKYLEIYSLS